MSISELQLLFKKIMDWSDEQIEELTPLTLQYMDSNKDGFVSYEEFINWLCFMDRDPEITGLSIKLEKLLNVPKSGWIMGSWATAFVKITVLHDGKEVSSARSASKYCADAPSWNETLTLVGNPYSWDLATTEIKFEVFDEDLMTHYYVGEAILTLGEMIRRPNWQLLVNNDGEAVLSPEPERKPCEIWISLDSDSLPRTWPKPIPREEAQGCYPRHIFMMSRGTRGDVQPFVALARGMAEELGWRVTICTELRWKTFIKSYAKNLKKGKIQFLPCGGDTQARVDGKLAKWMMESKTEILQTLMLAFSEAEFYNSGPVFVHQMRRLQEKGKVDLIVGAFTLIELSLLVSECCNVPAAGFILQPSCIPSSDKNWKAVINVDSGNLFSFTDYLEDIFSSQRALRTLKGLAESNPFASFSASALRREFGLSTASSSWETIFKQNVPMIIPMAPGTFERPSDWNERIILTDYIFLRDGAGGGQLAPDIRSFITKARAGGLKPTVMSFSSMPVARKKMLIPVVKMLEANEKLALIYVGKRYTDSISSDLEAKVQSFKEQGRLLESEKADFGVLFDEMDCFIVHGGLGTTVEALRRHKPVAVTGVLLMDQRFWGGVCQQKGVGPSPVHIDEFPTVCVDFINQALADDGDYLRNAKSLTWGNEADDGVSLNVNAFAKLFEEGIAPDTAA